MPVTIFTSDRYADHLTPPGHPERVQRAEVMQVVAAEFRRRGGSVIEPRSATDEELIRVHDPEYVAQLMETAGRAVALDADTFTSPDTYDVARLAAGAAVEAVDYVLDSGIGERAFALMRPPGHHAERNRAMGFCFFNNVAIAAAHARARGLSRVAIVDFDVHHCNGTQWSFYDDPSVLVISSHQYPYYPGTGAADEIGVDAGQGFTVNFPMEAGSTDADYDLVYGTAAIPILRQFRPELILVSAGFDAHEDDPLGGMRVTTGQFGALMQRLADAADECCDGRLVAVTEGGYDLKAFAGSMLACLDAMCGRTAWQTAADTAGATRRGSSAIEAARESLASYWTI